jgi:hypothetical protein
VFPHPEQDAMIQRLALSFVGLAALAFVACGGGHSGSATGANPVPPAAPADLCASMDLVGADLDALQRAISTNDADAASAAAQSVRAHLVDARDEADAELESTEVRQSAADLVHSLEGLQTTIRQFRQADSLEGLVDQLLSVVPAIVSSYTSLRDAIGCK